jgi:MFS family permease
MNLCWSAWLSVMVLYAVAPGPGGLSESGYGILVAGIGAGGLLGAVIVAPAQRAFGARWVIGADLLGTFAMVAVPTATANPWAVGAAAFAGGVGSTMWSITVASVRQRVVPDALLGRVGGALRLFGYGALSLGAALAGVVAELAGVRAVFACCAVLAAFLVLPFLAYVTEGALDDAGDRRLLGQGPKGYE